MTRGTMGRLAEALRYSAIWHLEKAEYAELTDEEDRNVKTFWALEKSVENIQTALKQDLLGLVRKYPDLFEQSLMVLLGSVSDQFRPTTAAAFVEKLNAQIEYVAENTKCPGCGERMKAIEHEPGRWRFECQMRCWRGEGRGGSRLGRSLHSSHVRACHLQADLGRDRRALSADTGPTGAA